MRIKICGLTRKKDVNMAVQLGADALGFILADSPRKVSLSQVKSLTQNISPFVDRTAVVVNPSYSKIKKIVESNLFNYIQFHGQKEPDFLKKIRTPGLGIIKAFSLQQEKDLKNVVLYNNTADYFLFDTRINNRRGGTGQTFDWSLLEKTDNTKPYILAGGLGPKNIIAAAKKTGAKAFDINSKIETKPGKKDRVLMTRLFQNLSIINKIEK